MSVICEILGYLRGVLNVLSFTLGCISSKGIYLEVDRQVFSLILPSSNDIKHVSYDV